MGAPARLGSGTLRYQREAFIRQENTCPTDPDVHLDEAEATGEHRRGAQRDPPQVWDRTPVGALRSK